MFNVEYHVIRFMIDGEVTCNRFVTKKVIKELISKGYVVTIKKESRFKNKLTMLKFVGSKRKAN